MGLHRLTWVALSMYATLAAVAGLAGWFLWGSPWLVALYPLRLDAVGGALGGAAAGGCLVVLSAAWERRSTSVRALGGRFRALLRGVRERDCLVLAAASSVAEELLFRGLLLPSMGLLLSSVVFGLLHTGPDRVFLTWTVAAVVVGGVFGLLTVVTGALWAATLAHFIVNWLNLRRIAGS